MKKKILLVIPALRFGGAERVLITLANQFVSKGLDVCLLNLQNTESPYFVDSRIYQIKGIKKINKKNKIIHILSLLVNAYNGLLLYRKVLRNYRPDSVLAFLDNASFIVLFDKILFHSKLNVVISERNDASKDSKVKHYLKKILFPFATTIVCQSEAMRGFYKTKLKIDAEKIYVIGNPLAQKSIYSGKILATSERKNKIIAIGKLLPQKNFELLINSIGVIKDKIPNVTVDIIGEGPERNKLQRIIDEQELTSMVKLVGNIDEPLKKYGNSKLFIMTSLYEGFPNVLIEAVSSGIPILTTNFSPGVAREIINKKNGNIISSFDLKVFSEAVYEALLRQFSVKDLKVIAYETKIKYSEKTVSKDWLKVLL